MYSNINLIDLSSQLVCFLKVKVRQTDRQTLSLRFSLDFSLSDVFSWNIAFNLRGLKRSALGFSVSAASPYISVLIGRAVLCQTQCELNDISTVFPGGPAIPRVLPWQQVSRVVIWSHLKRIAPMWAQRLRERRQALCRQRQITYSQIRQKHLIRGSSLIGFQCYATFLTNDCV